MKITWKFLTKVSVTALSTVTSLTMGSTAIQAATITGNFEISDLWYIGTIRESELVDDIIVGSFAGEDLDENGILSESELTDFSADIIGEGVTSSIKQLEIDNIFGFELDLETLDFDLFVRKQIQSEDQSPAITLCADLDDDPCLIERIAILPDRELAYFFDFEYFAINGDRLATFTEASILSVRDFSPSTFSVSLTSQPPATVPEPSVILGMLAVLGLGTQLKKNK
ncbi:MAG: PEP-CTERM sorting domain-containing protein [Microcoleaceae cyanobacterium]